MSSEKSKAIAKVAALELAADIESGKLDPATLDAELAGTARALFAVVVDERDPLWPVQLDVARQVIHAGGVSLDELREWVAVLQRRTGESEPIDLPDPPGDTETAASVALSPEID